MQGNIIVTDDAWNILALTRSYEVPAGNATARGDSEASVATASASATASDASPTPNVVVEKVAVGQKYPFGNVRQLAPMTAERLDKIIADALVESTTAEAAATAAAASATATAATAAAAAASSTTTATSASATSGGGGKQAKKKQQQQQTLRDVLTTALDFGPRVTMHCIAAAQLSPKLTLAALTPEV